MKTPKLIFWMLALVCGGELFIFWVGRTRGSSVAPSDQNKNLATAFIADAARPLEVKVRASGTKSIGSDLVPDEGDDEDDEESNRTPEEKKLAADIEKALAEEDFELAKKCAPQAMKCKDVEIRQSMVDTLAWFGEKAIPELTPYIADPDEDIAENAMNEWDSAVSSIDDDREKIGMTELAMHVISNEDALESISGNYIGVDEKLAVESLLRVIESGGSAAGVAKAKETYEFVTGEEFTDRSAAEKWIAEEYEPSEGGN